MCLIIGKKYPPNLRWIEVGGAWDRAATDSHPLTDLGKVNSYQILQKVAQLTWGRLTTTHMNR